MFRKSLLSPFSVLSSPTTLGPIRTVSYPPKNVNFHRHGCENPEPRKVQNSRIYSTYSDLFKGSQVQRDETWCEICMCVATYFCTSFEVACRDAYPNSASLLAESLWLLKAATYLAGLSLSSHIPTNTT